MNARRGFTLVEIMIVVGVIAALAALAMPNLLRAKTTANESMAQASLKVIVTGQVSYRISHDNYATIAELQPYIDSTLATGTKNGYNYFCAATANTFVATAVPVAASTGVTHFCVTEDGVIRMNPEIITSTDHDTCMGYNSI